MPPPIIFCVTPKHTGTNSVCDLLCQSPDVDAWYSLHRLLWRGEHMDPNHKCVVLHSHWDVGPPAEHPVNKSPVWKMLKPLLVEALLMGDVVAGREIPVISTVRDPLGAMVTHKRRRPKSDTIFIVEQFLTASARNKSLPIDLGFPLDLPFKQAGVRPPKAAKLRALELTPGDWGREPLRLYKARDLEGLKKLMPEIGYLQGCEGRLRPWLEGLGYRDLMWWSS